MDSFENEIVLNMFSRILLFINMITIIVLKSHCFDPFYRTVCFLRRILIFFTYATANERVIYCEMINLFTLYQQSKCIIILTKALRVDNIHSAIYSVYCLIYISKTHTSHFQKVHICFKITKANDFIVYLRN